MPFPGNCAQVLTLEVMPVTGHGAQIFARAPTKSIMFRLWPVPETEPDTSSWYEEDDEKMFYRYIIPVLIFHPPFRRPKETRLFEDKEGNLVTYIEDCVSSGKRV